ncbi:MAG TPA: hypothetical protein PKC34_06695 [Pseudomonadales bacterium]|jgi:acyl dehydratase|nr:hypothetical protein [Pseudomonadales bacterium]HMW83389.1 hypothetical protein [Pseudomonadales bacterium]HMZ70077.1 hypothetical protein [Pseudomonadales bacterium]HNB83418.1 hypothetical protein [Pseudomonadales bacterium]HND26297.1 hypothetical protein [Pseudomonadales bacterium]
MHTATAPTRFTQLHIDIARFSTDDFNPFHDQKLWWQIPGTPFSAPLVLGFQLAAWIEDRLRQHRQQADEARLIEQHGLRYSNYQFDFVSPVLPGDEVTLEIKPSTLVTSPTTLLRNRLLLRAGQRTALLGHKRESRQPLVLPEGTPPLPDPLSAVTDRDHLPGQACFVKRKFTMTGNGKNFLLGAQVDPTHYFNELEDRVVFPEMFPLAYLSCALLERGLKAGEDFMQRPRLYASQQFSVDRQLMRRVKSNSVLYMLVCEPLPAASSTGLRGRTAAHCCFPCFGVLEDGALLYRALMTLVPLAAIGSG